MDQKYSIVVFDLDGVLVDIPSSWGFVHEFFGETNEDNVKAYFGGEIDDHEFMRRDISIWKSYKPDFGLADISRILEKVPFMPGLEETLRALRDNQIKTAIISGGLEILAQRVNEIEPFDHIYANGLKDDGSGALDGEGILNVPLMNKEKVLKDLLNELSIPTEKCSAVGDSNVDSNMLKTAGLGICFCPLDDEIKQIADVVIEKKDLREILNYIL